MGTPSHPNSDLLLSYIKIGTYPLCASTYKSLSTTKAVEALSKKQLNFPYFIAMRLNARGKQSFSKLIVNIAIASIASGLAVMILSFAIFKGFKEAIQDKIFSFEPHIKATKFTFGSAFEEHPVSTSYDLYQHGTEIEGVSQVQHFTYKTGILKAKTEVYGVLMKGIGQDYDTSRFVPNLTAGRMPNIYAEKSSTELVISEYIARKLAVGLNDRLIMYFVQDPPRVRRMEVVGIYQTDIEDFDEKLVIGDHRLLQRLNSWGDTLVGGFEVYVEDFDELETVYDRVFDAMDIDLGIIQVKDSYVQFFDWFTMLNRNVYVFLIVIIFVACFNIVSIMLILIMERTNMIGTLKALGATNQQIRQVFTFNGLKIVTKGLLIGNAAGIALGWAQQRFRLVPLDPENYYMSAVPIAFDWGAVILLNAGTLLLIGLILSIPTRIISRLDPIKTIKFD